MTACTVSDVFSTDPIAFRDGNTSSPTMTPELATSVYAGELTDPTAVADYPCKLQPPAEDIDLINRTKARHRRRLQERWGCKAYDHTYCFATLDGVHIPLSEDAIEIWVSALVRAIFLLSSIFAPLLKTCIARRHSNTATPPEKHCSIKSGSCPIRCHFHQVYNIWEYGSIPASFPPRQSQPHRFAIYTRQAPRFSLLSVSHLNYDCIFRSSWYWLCIWKGRKMAWRADLKCFRPTGNTQAEMGHSQTCKTDRQDTC